jgi:hypothetical protein
MLQSTTSLAVVHLFDAQKTVTLNGTPSLPERGRLVYLKNINENRQNLNFSLVAGDNVSINPIGQSITPINSGYCVTLLENPAYTFSLVNLYVNSLLGVISNGNPPGGTTVVTVSGRNSFLCADLQTQSKVFVLPSIQSLTSDDSQSAYFCIKDVYGNAGTNNLYLSTSGVGETFEGEGNLLRFTANGQAAEIACEPQREYNRWYILSSV